jgi:type II secretory pathway component GspD/PulD (secretin)
LALFDALRLLDEKGAATIRNAPRILTLNNRRATILDGQRVTYVTRYSSYANLFETDTLDAGLTLSVLPSLGESGYLTLDIRAELTSLSGNISGSPVKDGQIVENTVIVKDGETVLLGGFQRTVEERRHRRFPLLGYALPFLFSREISVKSRRESFVAITPRVVDLTAGVDEKTRGILEGRPGGK